MNDRVSEELLAEAAGRRASDAIAKAGAGAVIMAEYEGQGYFFRADGWFNATLAAERYGKKPAKWLRLVETKRYIGALARRHEVHKMDFVKTSRGGDRTTQGTWLHPKLAVAFARWLNIDFAVWADAKIDEIIHAPQELGLIKQFFEVEVQYANEKCKVSASARNMRAWQKKKPELNGKMDRLRSDIQLKLGFGELPPKNA